MVETSALRGFVCPHGCDTSVKSSFSLCLCLGYCGPVFLNTSSFVAVSPCQEIVSSLSGRQCPATGVAATAMNWTNRVHCRACGARKRTGKRARATRTESSATPPAKAGSHTHTLCWRTHMFVHMARAQSHICTSSCVCTYTHKCLKRFVACARRVSPSRLLHSHVSPIFAVSVRRILPDFDVHDFLAELYPTQKRGSSALPHEHRGVWLPGQVRSPHKLRGPRKNQVVGTGSQNAGGPGPAGDCDAHPTTDPCAEKRVKLVKQIARTQDEEQNLRKESGGTVGAG